MLPAQHPGGPHRVRLGGLLGLQVCRHAPRARRRHAPARPLGVLADVPVRVCGERLLPAAVAALRRAPRPFVAVERHGDPGAARDAHPVPVCDRHVADCVWVAPCDRRVDARAYIDRKKGVSYVQPVASICTVRRAMPRAGVAQAARK